MTNQRRMFLTFGSISAGILLSFFMFKLKKGTLGENDYFFLGTIYIFSFALIFGISLVLRKWNDNDKLN